MLDDATVDEHIAVFDVDLSGVLNPTQLTALLEREQLRISKTKSGRAVIERNIDGVLPKSAQSVFSTRILKARAL